MIENYQTKSVVLTRLAGTFDRHGNPAYQAPVPVAARVQYKRHYVRSAMGNEVLCEAVVFVSKSVAAGPLDLLTTPDGRTWPIQSVESMEGFSPIYIELHIGGGSGGG